MTVDLELNRCYSALRGAVTPKDANVSPKVGVEEGSPGLTGTDTYIKSC